MKKANLVITGGFAAIAGGGLRVFAAIFTFAETTPALELLYFAIDVLLLFGLLTIFLHWSRHISTFGALSFAVSFIALASLVGPETEFLGINMYLLGAAVLSAGLAAFALCLLKVPVLNKTSYFWLASFSCGTFSILANHQPTFLIAGILFGLGFVAAGTEILVRTDKVAADI